MASENVTKEWTFEPIVSSGGVTKRTAVGGEAETSRPEYPPKSTFRFESYRVRLAKDEREVDAGEDFSFVSGTNAVVPGFEIAAASMRPGERASFRVRFEEAYGTKGHAAAGVPPYADLLLDLHLRTVDAPDSSADDEGRLPELEDRDAVERRRRAEAARGANERNSERAVVVDGEPVKIDGLGPMVLNKNGTISRITNWHNMTPDEQAKTVRIIGKRNRIRREKLMRTAAAAKTAKPRST